MQWQASAPSNIALIKYMGKQCATTNIPLNDSLSYTLDQLVSCVEMEQSNEPEDHWAPLELASGNPFTLKPKAIDRFLGHLALIKQQLDFKGYFKVRSNNNFPLGSGLASSASSFAALTRCATKAIAELTQQPLLSVDEQAKLSRQGSGSSCRSFYSPWGIWRGESASAIELPYSKLNHQVIIISEQEKSISSSLAHQLVTTSAHFEGRVERAQNNLTQLLKALKTKDWSAAYQIAWAEFWDMHQLFTTAEQAFDYMNEQCLSVLKQLQASWEINGDGPLITMDAGPNIHLLYRDDQQELAMRFHHDNLKGKFNVL